MIQPVFAALVVSLVLAACSVDSNESGRTRSGKERFDPSTLDSSTENSALETFRETYQIAGRDCDTGRHDFSAGSSEAARRQMCEALQDDALNRSCAETKRREHFEKQCPGFVWTPRYEGADAPSGGGLDVAPSAPNGLKSEDRVRRALENLLVDRFEVASEAFDEDRKLANRVGQDILSCGVGPIGPKCLGAAIAAVAQPGILGELDRRKFFFSEIRLTDGSGNLALLFEIRALEPKVELGALEISRVLWPRNGQNVTDFLKQRANLVPLLRVEIASDFWSSAWRRLERPRDAREIFHLSREMLSAKVAGEDPKLTREKISRAFNRHRAVLAASEDWRYQEGILDLISRDLTLENETFLHLCLAFLNSKSETVRQIAALTVLENRAERTDLKPVAIKALTNPRWEIRKKAVSALVKTEVSSAELNSLILRVADPHPEVRKTAFAGLGRFALAPMHLASLRVLVRNPLPGVRLDAAKLLARIQGADATRELTALLGDRVVEVGITSSASLTARPLGEDSIEALRRIFVHPSAVIRREVVRLLARASSPRALAALQIQLRIEVNSEVRAELEKAIQTLQPAPSPSAPPSRPPIARKYT